MKAFHLKHMGIAQWERRGLSEADALLTEPRLGYFYQLSRAGRVCYELWMPVVEPSDALAELAHKIANALSFDADGGLVDQNDIHPRAKPIELLHSLEAMLENPALKRAVWEGLKQATT